jgi:hypothetical protein
LTNSTRSFPCGDKILGSAPMWSGRVKGRECSAFSCRDGSLRRDEPGSGWRHPLSTTSPVGGCRAWSSSAMSPWPGRQLSAHQAAAAMAPSARVGARKSVVAAELRVRHWRCGAAMIGR